jgi:hypothetical protein
MDVAPSFIYSDNDDNFKSTHFQTTKDEEAPSRNELTSGRWVALPEWVDRKKRHSCAGLDHVW